MTITIKKVLLDLKEVKADLIKAIAYEEEADNIAEMRLLEGELFKVEEAIKALEGN